MGITTGCYYPRFYTKCHCILPVNNESITNNTMTHNGATPLSRPKYCSERHHYCSGSLAILTSIMRLGTSGGQPDVLNEYLVPE